MTRRETAEQASPMQGDKPYQKWARSALPLLVRQAKARRTITYQDLAKELGMPNPRNLNFPLGSIGTSLQGLGEEWDQPIPKIQALVINKSTNAPGPGIDEFLDGFAALSPEQQLEQIRSTQREVYDYRRWDDVLDAFGLKYAKPPITDEEIFGYLMNVPYDRDLRLPPESHRRGQFVVGWNDATVRRQGLGYTVGTLKSLTWRNLGFRLGDYFGKRPKEEIEQVWAVLASHYDRTRGSEAADLTEEIDSSQLVEGAKRNIVVNTYERNSAARVQCLAAHGVDCVVCGFNFGKRYGLPAEGYIHVHHLRPLSEINASYVVDPKEDLRPVCPNCHAVIHRGKKRPFTLEEVGEMLNAGETARDA